MLRTLLRGWVVGILLFALAGGCIAVGSDTHEPTIGQELVDLKFALDRGAISAAEFEAKKADLLARR